jgi:tRNA(Arg) A34 adenosine deaminase TadA
MKFKKLNWFIVIGILSIGAIFYSTTLIFAFDDGNQPIVEDSFCYKYDPQYTHVIAVEDGSAYGGIPAAIEGSHPELLSDYIQPWSGYIPECTLEDQENCKHFPVQTANIKADMKYQGIEVGYNKWQKMACEEALISAQHKGGPFGAVIVQIDDETGEVIRYWRNHNHVIEWNDPTAHAEVSTIRVACKQLGVSNLGTIHKDESNLPQQGATSHCEIYVNGEPCPMCYSAICWAGIPVVVFAATRYDAAAQGVDFGDETIYDELALPYNERQRKIRQASSPNSLDAFNYWKRSKKINY